MKRQLEMTPAKMGAVAGLVLIAAGVAVYFARTVNVGAPVPPRALPIGMPAQWTPARPEGYMPPQKQGNGQPN